MVGSQSWCCFVPKQRFSTADHHLTQRNAELGRSYTALKQKTLSTHLHISCTVHDLLRPMHFCSNFLCTKLEASRKSDISLQVQKQNTLSRFVITLINIFNSAGSQSKESVCLSHVQKKLTSVVFSLPLSTFVIVSLWQTAQWKCVHTGTHWCLLMICFQSSSQKSWFVQRFNVNGRVSRDGYVTWVIWGCFKPLIGSLLVFLWLKMLSVKLSTSKREKCWDLFVQFLILM